MGLPSQSGLGDLDPQESEPGVRWCSTPNKHLQQWLDCVKLPYHSPRKYMHGHATYALKRCEDVADLKAVTQNLMHSSLQVTDAVYSVLSEDNVGARIASMSGDLNATWDKSEEELVELLQAMLHHLESSAK